MGMHAYHMHQDTKIGPINRMCKRTFKLKISLSTVSENLSTISESAETGKPPHMPLAHVKLTQPIYTTLKF